MSIQNRDRLSRSFGLDSQRDVYTCDAQPMLVDVMDVVEQTNLIQVSTPSLNFPEFTPVKSALLQDKSVFEAIEEHGSVLLQHPYECFTSSVARFLKEASEDDAVVEIRMTLYRTSDDGRVIEHLVNAAKAGKRVLVVVELRASFDEENNIGWTQRLQSAGVEVSHGPTGYKTHCKIIHVKRMEAGRKVAYVHLGTGNYHAGTARMYTDFGLLTNDPGIGRDACELFDEIARGRVSERGYRRLLVAPHTMKNELIGLIRVEADNARRGAKAHIQIKANALEDPQITSELYAASKAGVRVDLIIRDICRLRPQLPGVSENIRVVSIVGRFLEHARLFYFYAGGRQTCYMGSADMMSRNLDQRVELLCPVDSPVARLQIRRFLDWQLRDSRGAWDMRADGVYLQRNPQKDGVHSQSRMIHEFACMEQTQETNSLLR